MPQAFYDEVILIIGDREMGRLLSVWSRCIPHGEPFATNIEHAVEKKILNNDRFGPVARNIVRLWYLGSWLQLPREWREKYGATAYDTSRIVSPEAYKQGLVWIAAEAHPLAAKQQGFGSWAKKPLKVESGEGR